MTRCLLKASQAFKVFSLKFLRICVIICFLVRRVFAIILQASSLRAYKICNALKLPRHPKCGDEPRRPKFPFTNGQFSMCFISSHPSLLPSHVVRYIFLCPLLHVLKFDFTLLST